MGQRRQARKACQHMIRAQPVNRGAFRAEPDQRHPDPGCPCRFQVRFGIPDQKRPLDRTADAGDSRSIGDRVRLADGQCVRADQRLEPGADRQLLQQRMRQRLGLVGADGQGKAGVLQRVQRRDDAVVKPGVTRDVAAIEVQQAVEIDLLSIIGQQHVARHASVTCPQHRASAVKRDPRVGSGVQQRPQPPAFKAVIGGGNQVGGGICKRPVQIENNGAAHSVTFR